MTSCETCDAGLTPNTDKTACGKITLKLILIQGGPKVSLHTLGLIAPPCFIFEGCCFADGTLYLLVRGFRRQNLRI